MYRLLRKIKYSILDFKNLIYHYKDAPKDIDFSNFIDAKTLVDSIKHKKTNLVEAVKNQKEFNSKIKDKKNKVKNKKKQENEIENITNLYDAPGKVINFYQDYSLMIFNAAYDAKPKVTKGEGLKILTLKQTLQRLPIFLHKLKLVIIQKIY